MDISLLLTILGIIATVVFGFLSIDLFKRKRNPGKLTLIKHSALGLFNNIAKNFDEISIQYKGRAIQENVIYIKGSIINDGDIDIDGSNVERTVHLNLNEGLKWIKAKITETSPELVCGAEIQESERDISFNFGLIRKKEFFQFEALVETQKQEQKAEDIFDNITITHRIANTQKVKMTALLTEEQMTKKKKKMKSFALNLGVQFVLIIGLLIAQVFYFKSAPIQYIDQNNIAYEAKATSDLEIELKNLSTDEERIIPLKEFQQPNAFTPFIPEQTIWEKIKSVYYMLPILLVLIALFIGWEYLELRRSYKLYDIFSKSEEK
ncbi:MAG: hypothetical protein ACSHW4_09760 [Cellulophaga sp.]